MKLLQCYIDNIITTALMEDINYIDAAADNLIPEEHTSSARVAVLLRKMAEKGLIVREGSPDDARKSMISLSDKGRSQIEKLNEERINVFQGVINRLGKEKTEQFIQLSGELKKAFEDEIAEREASGKGGDL